MIQPRLSSASGNSGAKFLQTHDRRFYVKCISREEVEMMHNIMPKYHQVWKQYYFVTQYNDFNG